MVSVNVINGELSKAEINAYIKRAHELYPEKTIESIDLKLDGDFGTNSEFALKEFQKARGLTVDGDCGPATWAALLGK